MLLCLYDGGKKAGVLVSIGNVHFRGERTIMLCQMDRDDFSPGLPP